MADLEAKALDKETLDEIKSELEETKKIIKGIGDPRTVLSFRIVLMVFGILEKCHFENPNFAEAFRYFHTMGIF